MSIYRNISTTFWTDTKVSDDFTPEDKYFMLYCLTNSYTNLCGCYEISQKQIANDMGYDIETINKLIARFTNVYKVILYNDENKELYIKNWSKYNWTNSNKLDKPLIKEIDIIKTPTFKRELVEIYNKRDTVSIPYTYPIDTVSTTSGYPIDTSVLYCTGTVTDTVTDTENKVNNKTIYKYFTDNLGNLVNERLSNEIDMYLEVMEDTVIKHAIDIAVDNNSRTWNYVKSILNRYKSNNIKTLADVMADEDKFNKKKTPDNNNCGTMDDWYKEMKEKEEKGEL